MAPKNHLWLNPKSAKKLNVKKGDRVLVKSTVGQQRIKVRVTKEIREDTVYLETGFGVLSKMLTGIYRCGGACIAEVLEDHHDEICGNMAMHETQVTISKI